MQNEFASTDVTDVAGPINYLFDFGIEGMKFFSSDEVRCQKELMQLALFYLENNITT